MKDRNHPSLHKVICRFFSRLRGRFWSWVPALLLLAACAAAPPPPPSPPPWPSRVITKEGLLFTVHKFRLPGTAQEVIVKVGDAKQWLPLNLIQTVSFSGALKERYRPAEIMLISGEKFKGEVFVGTLVEGVTDLGYWNMPFERVERLDLGTD